jgi:rubrerythrin
MDLEEQPGSFTVWRCTACGDTFPAEESEGARCPSCGGDRLETAGEPLL